MLHWQLPWDQYLEWDGKYLQPQLNFSEYHMHTPALFWQKTEGIHFVPGCVSVHTLDCNSILGLRILQVNRLLSTCIVQICDFTYICIHIYTQTRVNGYQWILVSHWRNIDVAPCEHSLYSSWKFWCPTAVLLSSSGRMHMTRAVGHGKVMRSLVKKTPSPSPSCFFHWYYDVCTREGESFLEHKRSTAVSVYSYRIFLFILLLTRITYPYRDL